MLDSIVSRACATDRSFSASATSASPRRQVGQAREVHARECGKCGQRRRSRRGGQCRGLRGRQRRLQLQQRLRRRLVAQQLGDVRRARVHGRRPVHCVARVYSLAQSRGLRLSCAIADAHTHTHTRTSTNLLTIGHGFTQHSSRRLDRAHRLHGGGRPPPQVSPRHAVTVWALAQTNKEDSHRLPTPDAPVGVYGVADSRRPL